MTSSWKLEGAEKRHISLVFDGIALSTGVIMSLRYLLSLHDKEGERKKTCGNFKTAEIGTLT